MTDRVLGGSSQLIYDVSGLEGWRLLGGEALPVFVTGTGEVDSDIVPPVIPDPAPLNSLHTSSGGVDWLIVDAVDYLLIE